MTRGETSLPPAWFALFDRPQRSRTLPGSPGAPEHGLEDWALNLSREEYEALVGRLLEAIGEGRAVRSITRSGSAAISPLLLILLTYLHAPTRRSIADSSGRRARHIVPTSIRVGSRASRARLSSSSRGAATDS